METLVEWLKNLLRAGGQKAFAIALACGLLIWVDHNEIFALSSGIKETIVIIGVTSACVAVTSIGSAISKWLYPVIYAEIWKFNARKKVKKYLPHLTEKDKEIISYLLARNQTIFTCDSDGEEARTLISAGLVIPALQRGQPFVEGEVPHTIPDYVWSVLIKNKDLFPPTSANDDEPHPWRTSWMAKRI